MSPTKCLFCFCLCLFSLADCLQGQAPVIRFDAGGLSSLKYRGAEFLARGGFQIDQVSFLSHGSLTTTAAKPELSVDRVNHRVHLATNWGGVYVGYLPQADKLLLRIKTVNNANSPLVALSYDVLALHLPSRPTEFNGSIPLISTNIGSPTIIPLTYRT